MRDDAGAGHVEPNCSQYRSKPIIFRGQVVRNSTGLVLLFSICLGLAAGGTAGAENECNRLRNKSEQRDENGDGSIDVKRTIWTRGEQRDLILEDRIYSDGRVVSWKDTVLYRGKPAFIQSGAPRNEGFLLRTYVQSAGAGIMEIQEKGRPDLVHVLDADGAIVDALTRNREGRLTPLSDEDLAELRCQYAAIEDVINSLEPE